MSDELKLKLSLAKKGKKFSEEHIKNLSLSHKGKMPSNIEMLRTYNIGRKLSEQTIEKIKQSNLGKKHNISKEGLERMRIKNYDVWNKGMKGYNAGENNPRWVKDRSMLKKCDRQSGSAYTFWRMEVYKRDNFRCKMSNGECSSKIEAHHILTWKESPELRYEISNGITLCTKHHPRQREAEIKLADFFKSLIS